MNQPITPSALAALFVERGSDPPSIFNCAGMLTAGVLNRLLAYPPPPKVVCTKESKVVGELHPDDVKRVRIVQAILECGHSPWPPSVQVSLLALMVENGYRVGPILPWRSDFVRGRFEKTR